MKVLEQFLGSLKPATNSIVTVLMAAFANLDKIASVVALVVLLLQLKVVYYNGKLKKREFEEKG